MHTDLGIGSCHLGSERNHKCIAASNSSFQLHACLIIANNYKQDKNYKVKLNVTLVQALRLCNGRTAHRGSRGIALLFHDQRH
jgi:hypothetical protein